MNTTKNTTADTPKTQKYWVTLSALDMAVIKQLNADAFARNVDGGKCEIDEETAQKLADVCRCSAGAAGGFSGFIYNRETADFVAANRAEIVALLREQIDGGLFTDENGKPRGVVCAVMSFNCFKGEDPAELEEEVARVLFGPVADIRSGELDRVANALAWFALEDLSFKLDGQELDGDDDESADA